MPYVVCPGCNEELRIAGVPRLGQRVFCDICEDELEVVSTEPVEIDWIYSFDDDDDDDDDDDYDDEED